jgi:nucleotide-binding universal stress UspA family protein
MARYYGAKFFLVHVISSLGFRMAGAGTVAAATELAWRDLRQLERELVASGKLTGLDHKVIVRDGNVWTELERVIQQERIDMLVIGTHSHKGLAKLVLGSVAEQIFRHASCPVLTVGPNSPADAEMEPTGMVRPQLFATDFGEGSKRALPYAISFANLRKTKLVLLHVLSPVPRAEGNRLHAPGDPAQMQKDEQATTCGRLKELIENTAAPGVESVFMAEFGEPAEGILRAAEVLHAEVIIMGLNSRAHVDMISHLPRSTAYEVVCRAGCAVLTVRS